MPDLFSAGAEAFRGAANTVIQGRQLEEERRRANLATLQSTIQGISGLVERSMAERGATERQKQKEEAESLTLNEPLAQGLAKQTGDNSWLKLVGQKFPADQLLGLYTASLKQDISQNYTIDEIIEGDKARSILLNKRTGERFPLGLPGKGKKTGAAGRPLGMKAGEVRKLFPGVDFGKIGDDVEMPTSVVTSKILQDPTAMQNLIRIMSIEKDPILGGLKGGAQERTTDLIGYIQNIAGGEGKVLVYIPPGIDDRLPDGGTALVPKTKLAEYQKQGVRPVTFEEPKKKGK